MALRRATRCTPIAIVIVINAGSPSGMVDTAMLTTAWKRLTKSIFITHLP